MKALRSHQATCEPLETRSLFDGVSVPMFAAGIRFGDDPTVFVGNGVLDASGAMSGTLNLFTLAGSAGSAPYDWVSYTRGPNDAATYGTRSGFSYSSQSGSQFVSQDGYSGGTLIGNGPDGSMLDWVTFGEQSALPGVTPAAILTSDYAVFNMLVITASGVQTVPMTLLRVPGSVGVPTKYVMTYQFETGDVSFERAATVAGLEATTFSGGELLYQTFAGSSGFVFVDTDPSDGIVGVGAGLLHLRSPRENPTELLIGTWRGSVAATDTLGREFFSTGPANGAGVSSSEFVLSLDAVGTYAMYRASDYDAGDFAPVSSGTWYGEALPAEWPSVRTRLVVTDGAGRTGVFHVNHPESRLMVPATVVSAEGTEISIVSGRASSPIIRPVTSSPQEVTFEVTPGGRLIAYERVASNDPALAGLFRRDLISLAGGEEVEGSVYSWRASPDSAVSQTFVAVKSADGDMLLWTRDAKGRWGFRNLTSTVKGAEKIVGDISGAAFARAAAWTTLRTAMLLARTASGELVSYHALSGSWAFEVVGEEGFGGDATALPTFTTPLTGFGSAWGAYHFSALDADGVLWALWRSSEVDSWQINNLSTAAGGMPKLFGRIAASTADWGSLHVSALSAEGHVISAWWHWQGSWQFTDLTTLTGGQPLVQGNFTSNWTDSQDTINIVGLDTSGNIRIYWWRIGGPWLASAITARSDGPIADLRIDGFQARQATGSLFDNFQTLSGRNSDGQTVRFVWRLSNDQWVFENLSLIAPDI